MNRLLSTCIYLFCCSIYVSYAQDIYETFSICSGETVFFKAPNLSAGPGTCTPEVFEIVRQQTGETLTNGETGFQFQPEVGLHVIISKGGCQYLDPLTGLQRSYRTEATRVYDVVQDSNCPLDDDPLFTEFSWLQNLVDPNNCSVESIDVYQSGIFKYLLFNRRSFDRILYFQDGTEYCRQTSSFDCVALYGLGEPIDQWVCGENIESESTDCTVVITNTECRSIGVFDIEGNALGIIPPKFGGPPIPDLADPQWVDPEPLTMGEVREYLFKAESISVGSTIATCDNNNISVVSTYNNSCTDVLGIDSFLNDGCRILTFSNIYGSSFTLVPGETKTITQSIPLPIYVVTAQTDTITILEIVISGGNTIALDSGGCEDEESDDQVFIDFPWLSTVISPQCNEGSVTVYQSGVFQFLFVRTEGYGKLYFQDGTFYCQNSDSNDCIATYQLSNSIDFWSCAPIGDQCEIIITNTQCKPMGVFDSMGNLLTTLPAAPFAGLRPDLNPQWIDPVPLGIDETRNYIIKDELLIVATKTASCLESTVNTDNPYTDSCDDDFNRGVFANTGCRPVTMYYTNGDFRTILEPDATFGPTTISNRTYIFVADSDTIGIFSNEAGEINSGGCDFSLPPSGIPDDFERYDVIYNICKGDSLVINNPSISYQCTLPPECFTSPIICENFPRLLNPIWFGEGLTVRRTAPFPQGTQVAVFKPSQTTKYIAHFESTSCGFGPSGPRTSYTYLVIVDESSDCSPSVKTNFNIETCVGDTLQIPVPSHNGICSGTFSNVDGLELLDIVDSKARVVVQNSGVIEYNIDDEIQGISSPGLNFLRTECPDAGYQYTIQLKSDCQIPSNELIFEEYLWLTNLLDESQCSTETIDVYKTGIFTYLFITDSSGSTKMYNESGIFYCQNSANFDCVDAYNLGPPISRWSCVDDSDCMSNSGTVFLRPCDNGQIFFFIQMEAGDLLDPYLDDGLAFDFVDGQRVNFDFIDASFASPCTIAQKAVTLTCIELGDNPVADGNCQNFAAEIVSLPCDDGTPYFFLQNSAGDLLDAYLAAGIDYTFNAGQMVNVDYEIAHFLSPCAVADNAVIITCIENDGGISTDALFEEFSFLTELIDPNNCARNTVDVYDQGTYSFVFVESGQNASLYLDNGTLFCTNSASNNCLTIYGLNNPSSSWTCASVIEQEDVSFETISTRTDHLLIYPNPTQGTFSIYLPKGRHEEQTIRVYNVWGEVIESVRLDAAHTHSVFGIDLADQSDGIYYVEWWNGKQRDIQKILKQSW